MMRRLTLALVTIAVVPGVLAETGPPRLPLSFIPNAGQTHPDVVYHVKGPGPDAYLTRDGIVYAQAPDARGAWSAVRFRFESASPDVRVEPLEPQEGTVSFYLGRDPEGWRVGLPTSGGVAQRGILPGVDVLWSGKEGRLKSDIVIAPGVDASAVRLRIEGASCVTLGADGALHVGTVQGDIVEKPPVAWQRGAANGPVAARFVLLPGALVGFEVSGRDPRAELVIDPVMDFATYLGGSADDGITAIEPRGDILYVAGRTRSLDFPTVAGAFPAPSGSWDAFIAQIHLRTATVHRCTYFGGSGDETVVAASGIMGILGSTTSPDLPLAGTVWDGTLGGPSDAYWARFDESSLTDSTYWGGSGEEEVLCGTLLGSFGGRTTSPDLPLMSGVRPPDWLRAFQPSLAGPSDGFVAWPAHWGTARSPYIVATYIGGSDHDEVRSLGPLGEIALDAVPVAGRTWSADFPTTTGAFDRTLDGASDAFVLGLRSQAWPSDHEDPPLQRLHRSTLIGGAGDDGATEWVRAEDASGHAGPVGWTDSADFPLRDSLQSHGGGSDVFATLFDGDLSRLRFSTLFGGAGDEGPDVSVATFNISRPSTLVATTTSPDLTMVDPLQATLRGGSDVFAATLNLSALPPRLEWSTYLGGTALETVRAAESDIDCLYVAGATSSSDLPVRRAVQPALAGGEDGFLARFCRSDLLGQRPAEEVLPDVVEQLERIETRIEACDCAAMHAALAALQASAAAAAVEHARQEDLLDEILAAIAVLTARLDAMDDGLEREIERALFARDCMPWLWLPESLGGKLETAIALLEARLAAAVSSGAPGVNERVARARLDDAADAAASDPQRACRSLSEALHALTTP